MSTKVFNKLKIGVAVLLLYMQPAFSQQTDSLGVYYLSPEYPQIINGDSAFEGFPYFNIQVGIINLSSATFAGSIYIQLNIDTGGGALTYDTLNIFGNPLTIAPFDSVVVPVDSSGSYTFSPLRYKAGSNIVVVWPRLSGGTLMYSDSLFTEVFFVPLTGIHQVPHAETAEITIYPNPAQDFIILDAAMKNGIEGVRLTDVQGRLVKQYRPLKNNKIDLRDIEKGCYILNIIYRGQTGITRKFIKT